MKSVIVQSVLSKGLRSIIASEFSLVGVFGSVPKLAMELIHTVPDVLVIEMNPSISFETLRHVRVLAPDSYMVLWSDRDSPEFAARCLSLGIRGVISKTAQPQTHLRCLTAVAAGNLWMDQAVSSLVRGAPPQAVPLGPCFSAPQTCVTFQSA
jgi:DNA-binding NarL/FixJ family response regulator